MPSVAIIGASRGIGLELARQYAAAGWHVHATTRQWQPDSPLQRLTGNITLHRLDVRDSGQIQQLVAALADQPLNVLIHNAGIKDGGYSRDEIMGVNAEAPMVVTNALLDNVAKAQGRIVLMSSQLGARHGRTESLGDYGDSKAALNDAFRAVADDWSKRGVIAIVMHPGWVQTDMGGRSAPVTVRVSAAGIRHVVDQLQAHDHGRFLTYEGKEHPW